MTPLHPRDSKSGWEQWKDEEGTLYYRVTLTRFDQTRIGPRTWEMLQEAGRLINAALREPD